MGARTGRFAMVNGVTSLVSWSITDNSAAWSGVTSSTNGGTARRKGNRDWSGNWNAKGGVPPVMPGEYFDFAGFGAPKTGVAGGSGSLYSGRAIVDSVTITWNYETGEVVSYALNFSGHGALTTAASGTAITDASHFTAPRARDCDFSIGTLNNADSLPLTLITLTITAANTKVNDASGNGWQTVLPGNIDATLAVTANEDCAKNLDWDIGDEMDVKLYVGDDYWDIGPMQILNFSGLQWDRGGAVSKMTINFGLNADDGTKTGHITKPGAGAFWPTQAA